MVSDKNALCCKMAQKIFILGGLNYYVLAFKLLIWYNALIVCIHAFTLHLYLKNGNTLF